MNIDKIATRICVGIWFALLIAVPALHIGLFS